MSSASKRTWKLQEFVAHSANVNCLAMGHKSNQVLVTGGDDKKVNLWAIGRDGCLLSLSGHNSSIECVSFDHSEDMVCAGSQMGALKIWDLEATKLIRTMNGHKNAIKCMDFHPYGGYLTTGSCDMTIRLWDTRQRGCICTYSSHRMAVNSLQFSPDGQWIASGGEEGAIKVWDVRVGKVLKEFTDHSSSVTCVKFHPHEFLLASCSHDRTVKFWDMEKFQLVSATEKQLSPIRQLWFSEDGTCLLGGGVDGLQVLGWEPARQLDFVSASWGQIYDMTMTHNKLIIGWFHLRNVVLNIVNINTVYPFGGQPQPGPVIESSPFQKNTSIRKSFSKERPTKQVIHKKTLLDEKTVEESGTEEEEVPPIIPNFTDYTEVFCPSRALNRTPPPSTSLITPPESLSLGSVESSGPNQPSSIISDMRGLSVGYMDPPSPTYHSAPTSLNNDFPTQLSHRSYESIHTPAEDSDSDVKIIEDVKPSNIGNRSLRRQHSDGEKVIHKSTSNLSQNTMRSSNSELSLGKMAPPSRSLSFSRPIRSSDISSARDYSSSNNKINHSKNPQVEIYVSKPSSVSMPRINRQERSTSPEFIPIATDRPVGIDLEEFLPKSKSGYMPARGELSEQEALSIMMRGHESMMAVLATRQRSLQVFHSMWMSKNLKVAVESTVAAGDLSVILDILNIIVLRPSIWNLDICAILLPQINSLLQSKYESYMTTGCTALRLILRNFASVIASNVRGSGGVGVDIPREERIARCRRCKDLLLDIKGTLQTRRPQHPRLTASFADLQSLIDQSFH